MRRRAGISVGGEFERMTSRSRVGGGFNDILMTGWMWVCMAPAGAKEEKGVR